VAFQVTLAPKALLAAGTLNISSSLRRHGQIRSNTLKEKE